MAPWRSRTLVILSLAGWAMMSMAQCVSVFPYDEDFEAAPAWTPGGAGSDWDWGSPNKPIISGAGGGLNAWCIGGLTGTLYNPAQDSWLESPCFDFTNVPYPWISFKVFWEMERQYDGANLQYSVNGGASWNNVGAFGNAVDCLNDNWFNYGSITNLSLASPAHGWSGRSGATAGACVGGFGSNQWVEAKHCLLGCGGQPNVLLRFTFGSGTTCNSYDGFAVDDVHIENAPISLTAEQVQCAGDSVQFTYSLLGCGSNTTWDFGDPGSGAANTSTDPSPWHEFSGPGAFDVVVTSSGPCGISLVDTVEVLILDVSVSVTEPLCNGQSGSATAVINGAQNQPQFTWQPGGQTGAQSGPLPAGTYAVEVGDVGACTALVPFIINEPTALVLTAQNDTAVCAGAPILLQATAVGGTPGYTFQWSPSGPAVVPQSTASYLVSVEDDNGCTAGPDSVMVTVYPPVVAQFSNTGPEGCEPWCVTFTDDTPGAVQSNWTFGDGATGTGSPVLHCYADDGLYAVTLTTTDGNGCVGSVSSNDLVDVLPTPVAGFTPFPPVAIISNPNFLFLDGAQGADQWSWSFGDPDSSTSAQPSPGFTYADVACYTVVQVVSNGSGCADTASAQVCVEGEFALYVPNAFTPDGDGVNDGFIPFTTVRDPSLFEFDVFDRWGQPVFNGRSVSDAWDGKQAGIETPQGVYAWKVRLRDSENQLHSAQGHVVLLR